MPVEGLVELHQSQALGDARKYHVYGAPVHNLQYLICPGGSAHIIFKLKVLQ